MDIPCLVDNAPSAVDPKHGQIVAVPLARELATDPDQCRVPLKRQALDPPLVGSRRVACRLLALGDKLLEGLPLQLSLGVADDAGAWVKRMGELHFVSRDHPVVVREHHLGHRGDVCLVRPLGQLAHDGCSLLGQR
jgi:hypothetical protein